MNPIIPFNKPFLVGKELLYIEEAVRKNRHISGDGPFTRKCEKWLEEVLGCRKVLLTHSCTAALEMASILCDLKPGDEVIMPSFTFVSTANAFVLRGAIPVFVDIRPDTLNLDENLIEQAITARTRAVVAVHYAGLACEMDRILEITCTHELLVIEDAAQALLSNYNGKYLGALGHLGCLSFHETKNIISGEGGALLINDERFIERAEVIREKGTNRNEFFHGHADKYTWVDIGSSFLPSDIIGAFLYAQLEQSRGIIEVRCKLAAHYDELLRPLADEGFLQLPLPDKTEACNGHLYYILTRTPEERQSLIHFLREQGITAIFHYVPLHSSPAGIKYGRFCGNLSVTDYVSDRILRLPLFYEMTVQQIETVVEAIRCFYHEQCFETRSSQPL